MLCREIAERLDDPGVLAWLERECRLEPAGRRGTSRPFVARQHRLAGAVPDDRTVLIETFRDPAGELGLAVLTPFGGKLHHGAEAGPAQARLRERLGIDAGLPARRRRPPVPAARNRTSRRSTCSTG